MPAQVDVKRWEMRRTLSVWEMHTRDCPTCRKAHDDAEATAKILLLMAILSAAAGYMPAAFSLVLHAEFSRQVAKWFEEYHVNFDNHK